MLSVSKLAGVIAVLATVFYCVLAWYGGNFFAIVSGLHDSTPVSNFSRVAIGPLNLPMFLNMIHWQALAVASLLFALVLSARRGDLGALPIANHYGLLLLCLLINATGIASSTIAVGHVIG